MRPKYKIKCHGAKQSENLIRWMPFNSIFTQNGPRNFQVISFCHCQSERAQIGAAWVYFYMAMPHTGLDAHVLLPREVILRSGGQFTCFTGALVPKQNNAAGTRLATRVHIKNARRAERASRQKELFWTA
jgi:hypothetical protein